MEDNTRFATAAEVATATNEERASTTRTLISTTSQSGDASETEVRGGTIDERPLTETPPPPGFRGDHNSNSNSKSGGSSTMISPVSSWDGELLRGNAGGHLSAPPPPGYAEDRAEERTRVANSILWDGGATILGDSFGALPSAATSGGGISVSGGTPILGSSQLTMDHINKQRTTSFTNLAAVVGTGLADSIDDATRGSEHQLRSGSITGEALLLDTAGGSKHSSTPFDPSQDLSFARQSRHSASRLIGSNPSTYSSLGSAALLGPISMPSSGASYRKMDPRSEMEHTFNDETDPLSQFKVSTQHRRVPGESSLFVNNNRNAESMGFRLSDFSKDVVGVTVMEPVDFGRNSVPPQFAPSLNTFSDGAGVPSPNPATTPSQSQETTPVISRQATPDHLLELHRNMDRLNVDGVPIAVERGGHTSHQSSRSGSSVDLAGLTKSTEEELEPFLWGLSRGQQSRSLAITGLLGFQISDIRSTCEAFGALEFFRVDFLDRGLVLIGYYDIRSAECAMLELRSHMLRFIPAHGGDVQPRINIKFCIGLNASSQYDESLLVVSDLPHGMSEDYMLSMLGSFGSLRSVTRQAGSRYGTASSFLVEFCNIQDAKQALLELNSTQPWGPDVLVEVGARLPSDRKQGRDLLALIGRWRTVSHGSKPGTPPLANTVIGERLSGTGTPIRGPSRTSSPMIPGSSATTTYFSSDGNSVSGLPQQTTQLVLGPDGRYSFVVVNPTAFPQGQSHASTEHFEPNRTVISVLQNGVPQQMVQGASRSSFLAPTVHGAPSHQQSGMHGQQSRVQYWPQQQQQQTAHRTQPGQSSQPRFQQQQGATRTIYVHDGHAYTGSAGAAGATTVPYYAHVVTTQTDSSVSSGSGNNQNRRAPPAPPPQHENKDNRHLMLDLEAVETGMDTRTSLMVRNIPNKYTQQMLLSEFTEHGHGPGVIDFFYLPIDFKNKCNRGYAFINFVDYQDIISFHRQYFGQHWKIFNSDKICDITYARIQGKQGMLKRFENSALMEKDESYKPLVFVSYGPDKGKAIPFPTASGGGASHHHNHNHHHHHHSSNAHHAR